nr:PREDICTED: uncharacterized protein LOC105677102 [Linepithema humile]
MIERPVIDTDSGSPYENRKYIESVTRKVLKQNLNTEKQAAISSQDLHESFVESLDWHDDFDDDVKIRFGRGLKAIDETVISDSIKTRKRDNKLDVASTTNVSSKLRNSPPIFYDNSSISQDWHNNTITDLIDIFNVHHGASDQSMKKAQQPILMNVDSDEDLEVAEQKYVNHETPRIKRTAPSYRAFYDDMNHNQRDFEEADENLGDSFQLPNNLEDRYDGVYDGHATPYGNNDIQDLDPYFKTTRSTNSRKKKKPGKKHSSDKHGKKSNLHSSSSRNRRHHTHRSDMSKNADRGGWKPKKKDKSEASSLAGHTRVQKSKTAEQGFLRAGINEALGEKVLYENAEDQSTVKSEEDDARRKEITLLLAADSIDDESQMDVALHGELAGKIVEQIFQQASKGSRDIKTVQKNDQLKSVLAPGLQRNYKTEDVIAVDKIYRQGFNETGMNHTETMMKRIMELLGKLIVNEVQRKTCVFLSPDTREFLGWMLEVDQEEESFEEALQLPLVHEEIIPEQDSRRKFLFDATSVREGEEDISNLQKKVKVLETLVKEYNALTTKEKTEVRTVHDYLIRQLNQLLQYIETREAAGKFARMPIAAARTGSILQYQSAMPNATNASFPMTKDAFSSPISHAEPRHREIRSLDKVSTKQHRKTKREKIRNNRKNANRRKPIQRHKKRRKHQDRARLSPGFGKSRRKRANLKENNSVYLGYEKPTIYDSFDLLNAKLPEKKKKRKRELVDKKNAATENDRMLDLLPIKGKNRLEDEVILLNKREAWKRENEKQLEEVAFGKDMRNITRREKERLEKLAEGDKRKAIDEASSRTKREGNIRGISTVRGVDRPDKTYTASEIGNGESEKNLKSKDDNGNNGARGDKLELVERRINVFADNRSNAATDTAVAEVGTREKLATSAGANNQVKGKLCGINRETKIDKASGSTSRVNLTNDTKPRVSKERRKVSQAEKEADDNAVKLNRTTNYRSEETDPEIELKNLRRERGEKIYGVADRRMTDSLYDDDNLARNKFRKKYVAKLDEPGDLDARPENNLELLRLRSNKWSNGVVEWKLLPVMKRSPYYDDRALSRIRLMETERPAFSYVKDVELEPNVYLSSPKPWRFKHRKKRNKVRLINGNDTFSRGIYPKAKQAFEIARFENPRINSKIFPEARKLARLRNGGKSKSVAEFVVPFMLKASDREISRSRNDPELGDPMIYDGLGLRLPVWPYYDNSPILHFVPDIRGRDDDAHRYPAGVYLEYGPFKEHARNLNRRVARQNRFRLRTFEEEAVDFPGDNLGNESSESRFAHGKFRVKTDEPALANHEDYFVSNETKDTQKLKKSNETKIKLKR